MTYISREPPSKSPFAYTSSDEDLPNPPPHVEFEVSSAELNAMNEDIDDEVNDPTYRPLNVAPLAVLPPGPSAPRPQASTSNPAKRTTVMGLHAKPVWEFVKRWGKGHQRMLEWGNKRPERRP